MIWPMISSATERVFEKGALKTGMAERARRGRETTGGSRGDNPEESFRAGRDRGGERGEGGGGQT
eukprot:992871-Pleurochrysis_carterae.AAC.1